MKKVLAVLAVIIALYFVSMQNDAPSRSIPNRTTDKTTIIPKASATTKVSKKTMGISTAELLARFEGYFEPLVRLSGYPYYPLELKDNEKDQSNVLKILSDYCSLFILQQDGQVASFRVGSSDNEIRSNAEMEDIVICFSAALMVTDLDLPGDDMLTRLDEIMADKQEHTYNGFTYRYITTQPFSNVVALEVTPA